MAPNQATDIAIPFRVCNAKRTEIHRRHRVKIFAVDRSSPTPKPDPREWRIAMLPYMRNVEIPSQSPEGNTATEVRMGRLRLFFSQLEFIAFQLDGAMVTVCAPTKHGNGRGCTAETHRLHLEPDKIKWCTTAEFEKKWKAASSAIFKMDEPEMASSAERPRCTKVALAG